MSLEQKYKIIREALELFVGASKPEELIMMQKLISCMPEEDNKTVSLHGIHALIITL